MLGKLSSSRLIRFLYAKDARHIVQDRLESEEMREREREEEKRYKVALQNCAKQTKKWRMTKIDKVNRHKKRWIVVMKGLFRYAPM